MRAEKISLPTSTDTARTKRNTRFPYGREQPQFTQQRIISLNDSGSLSPWTSVILNFKIAGDIEDYVVLSVYDGTSNSQIKLIGVDTSVCNHYLATVSLNNEITILH